MAIQILFLLVAGVTLFSAGMAVTTRRMMHAALWLVLSLFGVALIFATLDSSFFAVVQVMVYIGAIAILIIFAVMLTRRMMDERGAQTNAGWGWALAASLVIFGGLAAMAALMPRLQAGPGSAPSGQILVQLGAALVNPDGYAIPFEVASVLLLAAMVGAIYVAVERKGGKG